jgi:Flp pilus assembly pilin Flp
MSRLGRTVTETWRESRFEEEAGATTIEYVLVVAFMASISIFATIWLIDVLENMVALLAIKVALFLTGFP